MLNLTALEDVSPLTRKQFKEIMLDMLDKGYRAYLIPSLRELEERLEMLSNRLSIEVTTYKPFRVIFVRDIYKKL
jgi:hypothetical protein